MKHLLRLSPLLLLVLAGCVRTNSATEVNADGSWKRSVKFILAKNNMAEKEPVIGDVAQPPTGAGWTSKIEKKDEEITYTYTRSLNKLDEVLTKDIALKEKEGLMLVNEVTVKQIAPNRYKYRETFKWVGKAKESGPGTLADAEIKKMMPSFATAEDIKKIQGLLLARITRILMGPGDPMLMQLASNPDYGMRKMVNRMAKEFDKTLLEVFGERMPDADRIKLVRNLIEEATKSTMASTKSGAQSSSGPGDSNFVSMYMSVKLPGRIVETDGEVDPFTGEVFWAMYPEAAAIGEVSIQATCEF